MGFLNFLDSKPTSKSGVSKKIKYVAEYTHNGKKDKIIFETDSNYETKVHAEARKLIEKKVGTFQFTLGSVYEY